MWQFSAEATTKCKILIQHSKSDQALQSKLLYADLKMLYNQQRVLKFSIKEIFDLEMNILPSLGLSCVIPNL